MFPWPVKSPPAQMQGLEPASGVGDFNHNAPVESIPEWLANMGRIHGQRIAIGTTDGDSMTHASLFGQIEKVVAELNNWGIGRGDRIALVLPDSLQMTVSFLGISAAATCAPLNPAFRLAEFDSIFGALAPRALVVGSGADSEAVSAARKQSIPIIEISWVGKIGVKQLSAQSETLAPASPTGFASAADVALILFTSGTTSQPKMVPLTHGNLLASAGNIAATLELSPQDRCLNIMPLFHIHGLVGGLLAPLVSGGSVVCPQGFSAEGFFACLEQFRPTWYTAVPAIHQAVLAAAQNHAEIIRRTPLRFIRSSSSALPARVMAELETVFGAPVIESYGMTEASHQIASNPLPPATRKPGSVGKPAGAEIVIMNDAGELQPTGSVAEVAIRGENVMRGYADSADANGAAFTRGWFRTGDQGYLDDEGYLFLTGRIKELINRGGEKISPREIDEVLLTHPAVEQAVTYAMPHPTLGEEVAAAVVLRPQMQTTAHEIAEYSGMRLAESKLPKQILIVSEIPRSATGKLQRSRLAELFAGQHQDEMAGVDARLESRLAAIYAEVLGVEEVRATDNFFALGGDSLRATQVISRVRAALDVNLSMAAVFRNPTVRELSAEIVGILAQADRESTCDSSSGAEEP
jgi:acyl-CoA synthetase (AMP-forming)/AMP-acid ligase II/acyl carrier protein